MNILRNGAGNPLSLDWLFWDHMREVLKKAGSNGMAGTAFRRGLASSLNRLGIDDSVIQAILRHSSLAVTQAHYIKTARPDALAAMRVQRGASWRSPAWRWREKKPP